MSWHRTVMKMSSILAGLVLASGCGGADSATAPEPVSDSPRATTITVSPFATELTMWGATVQLTAEVRDQNARLMTDVTVTWSSSDTSVATVDQAGLVTAVGTGTAAITASVGRTSASAGITVTAVAPSDRDVLVALYEATDGPNWINNENWLTDAPVGEWHGVDADASGRVVRLDLSGKWDSEAKRYAEHGLAGSIPPALGGLNSLEELRLRANYLAGPIPPELGNLTGLQTLHLGGNDLTGPIPPELGNLTSLRQLFLGSNDLTGPIPPELGNLTSLRQLFLGPNDLTGPIPPELGNLTDLEHMFLYFNYLTGPIPREISGLTRLQELHLSSNNLTGPIPPQLGDLRRLEDLFLYRNDLTGSIPPELARLTRLRSFDLGDNRLSGSIPTELGNLASSLTVLALSGNDLTGTIPPELGNLTRLRELLLHENRLSGMIPHSFLGLDMLNLFEFQRNNGLCAPSTAAFRTWLQGIQDVSGPFCTAPRESR